MSHLPMPWLLASAENLHQWYWLCRIRKFLSGFRRKQFQRPVSCQSGEMTKNASPCLCFRWKIKCCLNNRNTIAVVMWCFAWRTSFGKANTIIYIDPKSIVISGRIRLIPKVPGITCPCFKSNTDLLYLRWGKKDPGCCIDNNEIWYTCECHPLFKSYYQWQTCTGTVIWQLNRIA